MQSVKPPFMTGLRGRLALLLLAAFAVPCGMVVWQSIDERDRNISAALENLRDDVRLVVSRQQVLSVKAEMILIDLLLHSKMRPGVSIEECSRELSAYLPQHPEFVQFAKVRPDGDLECAAVLPKDRVNFADRKWFRQALQSTETVVSEVLTGKVLGKPIIVFAKALRDEAGQASAIFFVSIDLAWLRRELAKTGLSTDSRLVIIDGMGTVVVRYPDPEGWSGKNAAHMFPVNQILARRGEGVIEGIGLDGLNRLFAYSPLLDTVAGPMYLFLSMPRKTVTSDARRRLLISLVIGMAALAVSLGGVLWGGDRFVVRPLSALSRTAARIGAGNLSARSGLPYTGGEFGQLARIMDETAAAVQASVGDLDNARRALATLGASNRILLRMTREDILGQDICRVALEKGGFHSAFLCYLEDGSRIRTVAHAGPCPFTTEGAFIRWNGDDASALSLPCLALREGKVVVSQDIAADDRFVSWRDTAIEHGCRSGASYPLLREGTALGALTIIAAEPGRFTPGVTDMLQELADDVAFGIVTIRNRELHRQAEGKVRESKERIRLILDSTVEGLFSMNAAGVCTLVNRAAVSLLGYAEPSSLIGKNIHELIHNSGECPILSAMKAGKTVEVEEDAFRRADGTSLPVSYRSSVIRDEDRITGVVVSFIDLTEKLEIKRRRQITERMETMGNLAGGVAHDINNMLLPIITLSQMVMDDLPAGCRNRVRLEKVLQAAARAKDVVSRILAFSRQEETRKVLTDINVLVEEAISILRNTILSTAAIEQKLTAGVGMIMADATRIMEVIINLVVNASHALEGKVGTITVALSRVEVDAGFAAANPPLNAGPHAMIAVTDTGCGMSKEIMEKIFTPFFTTKPKGEGTGMGLSLVFTIVAKHGGVVTVRSAPDAGSTFAVYLPLAENGGRGDAA